MREGCYYYDADGPGSTVLATKGSWKDGSVCAQYEKATFSDRSKKKCSKYASWVMAKG